MPYYVIGHFCDILIDRRVFFKKLKKLDLGIIFTSEWLFSNKLKVKYASYENQDTIFLPFCLNNTSWTSADAWVECLSTLLCLHTIMVWLSTNHVTFTQHVKSFFSAWRRSYNRVWVLCMLLLGATISMEITCYIIKKISRYARLQKHPGIRVIVNRNTNLYQEGPKFKLCYMNGM